jgi:hypothetical protein
MSPENNDPNWLDEFEQMADDKLGEGSACEQVHPIVERWLNEWLDSDITAPRSSVMQALACLATEIINNAPESIMEALENHCEEDEVYDWIQAILITGQAFQTALNEGRLDDL